MAKIEGAGGGGEISSGGDVSFSESTLDAIKSVGAEALADGKITEAEAGEIKDALEESNPDAFGEIEDMSNPELQKALEQAFANELTGAEEAGKGEKKPEEAGKGGGDKGGGGGGGGDKGGADAAAASPLDINKDGKVDQKDFEELMKKFDKNKDGKLDKEEMKDMPEDLKKALDKDGDGTATKTEIQDAVKAAGETETSGDSLSASPDIASFMSGVDAQAA